MRAFCRFVFAGVVCLSLTAGALALDPQEVRFPVTARAPKITIEDVLKRLPEAVFDSTTDGVQPGELPVLIAKGTSESWDMHRISPHKVGFSAKHPSSEVTIRIKPLEAFDVIEVRTENQQAISHTYWSLDGVTGTLKPYVLKSVLRAYSEIGEGSDTWPKGAVPGAIATFVDRLETCKRWTGLQGKSTTDSGRQKVAQILEKLECGKLSSMENTLRQSYVNQPVWIDLIDKAGMLFGH